MVATRLKNIARLIIFSLIIVKYGISAQETKPTVAVLDFDARGISAHEVATLTERFQNNLFLSKQFILVERNQMEEILNEQAFQMSGCVSDECVVEVGKLLGVHLMVAGSVGKIGKLYTCSARIIDVSEGKIIAIATLDQGGGIEDLLSEGIPELSKLLIMDYNGEVALDKKNGLVDFFFSGGNWKYTTSILVGGISLYMLLNSNANGDQPNNGSATISITIP